MEACLNGRNCETVYQNQDVNVCNDDDNGASMLSFTAIDWQECGATGTYDITIAFGLPDNYSNNNNAGGSTSFSWYQLFGGYFSSVKLNAYLTSKEDSGSRDEDDSSTSSSWDSMCTMRVKTKDNSNQSTYSAAFLGLAAVMLTFGLIYGRKTQCVCIRVSNETNDEGDPTKSFQLMKDRSLLDSGNEEKNQIRST